ncbi:MAG: type II toxin-antitoxin system HipA family toxin [Bacilli bacterium]|nr:type II toxin-antitoxin system HipA family toxin [Bacilli bacterium]
MLKRIAKLDVFFEEKKVGVLAYQDKYRIAFEYDEKWIEEGFSLNPFYLPLQPGVFISQSKCFGGLFGVFADSLPDAWGRLLLDRYLSSRGIDQTALGPLEKLGLVGDSSFGALSYRPSASLNEGGQIDDLDYLNDEFQKLLVGQEADDIDSLYSLGGSSGGSRPKAYIKRKGEDWIVKFPHRNDVSDIGECEYVFMKTAEKIGIKIPEIELIHTSMGRSFFAIKRFDRRGKDKVFAISASSLLERDFSLPTLDYKDLFKLVSIMTKGDKEEMKQLYLLMCFNVFSKNQDDHGKNFSFLFDHINKKWSLAPAYDLTYSPTVYGEQSTTVDGKGKDIAVEDLAALGSFFLGNKKECYNMALKVQKAVEENLKQYMHN